jgi:hypothetical protein
MLSKLINKVQPRLIKRIFSYSVIRELIPLYCQTRKVHEVFIKLICLELNPSPGNSSLLGFAFKVIHSFYDLSNSKQANVIYNILK